MGFYAYLWLREDGTPAYVGKGSGNRAFRRHRGNWNPPPKERILLIPCETEAEAFAQEIVLIDLYGRKEDGTGILHNLTDGGENPPRRKKGFKMSAEWREKLRQAKLGKPSPQRGYKRTEETKQKMRKPRSHKWVLSAKTRQHQSEVALLREAKKKELRAQGIVLPSNIGKHWRLTAATKEKMRHKVFTAEHRANLQRAQQARHAREQGV